MSRGVWMYLNPMLIAGLLRVLPDAYCGGCANQGLCNMISIPSSWRGSRIQIEARGIQYTTVMIFTTGEIPH